MKFRYSVSQLEAIGSNPWLTDRERQVFDLYYRRGWDIESVAAELYVSRRTIDTTLRHIREKTII